MELLAAYTQEFWDKGFIILEEYFDSDLMDRYNQMILDHYGLTPDWEHTGEFVSRSATEVVPWFPYREGNTEFNTINDDNIICMPISSCSKTSNGATSVVCKWVAILLHPTNLSCDKVINLGCNPVLQRTQGLP